MPELRQNLATKEWVVISTERKKRPEEFAKKRSEVDPRPFEPTCPFCPGNEDLSLEILREPSEGPWRIRGVRNKYPALNSEGERIRLFDGVHRSMSGVGAHEVLIESPRHDVCPALESSDEVTEMLAAFQSRGRYHADDSRIEHVVWFKNHGALAGTSLVHPHTQVIGIPVVPYNVRARTDEARRYFDDSGDCVICRMAEDELDEKVRIVIDTNAFVAFVPFAAFSPFHLWIVPKRHRASFVDAGPEELQELGRVLRSLVGRLYVGLGDPPYNYVIRSSPTRELGLEYLHWYLVIVPRVSQEAGFELGSGMFINSSLPEESAIFLRDTPDSC
ncbi:MAG: DUF4931 domain-containing protein [Deltaproteobacteria bacterium]|nr:DUF4931 domain-containing protein [Deltaproteobacteria bacterium]